MPFEIYRTTAEHVIGATDAAFQSGDGVDAALVALFLDTTQDSARDALRMASQLGLLSEAANLFKASSPLVKYVCTSDRDQKASVMRLVLEQYEPFKCFKLRLEYATGVVGEASTQTRALCQIAAHRDTVSATLIDLGTYANAIASQGAGLYLPIEKGQKEYLSVVNAVVAQRQEAELFVTCRLGLDVTNWVNRNDVLESLVTAYQRLSSRDEDPRAPIVHAGNGFESLLSQLGAHYGVNVAQSHGINAKVDALGGPNRITTKHKFMAKYLGHVRNAVDHGVDAEIGRQWQVRPETAVEYVNVALTVTRDLVDAVNGSYLV